MSLESENDRLRNRVEELESLIGMDDVERLMDNAGLSKTRAKIAAMLLKRGTVKWEIMLAAIYPDIERRPSVNTLHVHVAHLRRIFAADQIEIMTRWGWGVEMPPASREILRKKMAGPA